MRGFAAGMVAGVLAVAATKLIASPGALPLAVVGVDPAAAQGAAVQWVDRSHKGDRLDTKGRVFFKREQTRAPKPERILTGCEPGISPLSASARAGNFPRRCVAELEVLRAEG